MTTFNLAVLYVFLASCLVALIVGFVDLVKDVFSKHSETQIPSYTEFREGHTSEFSISEYTDDDSIHLSHKRKDGTFVSTFITIGDLRKVLKYEKTCSN